MRRWVLAFVLLAAAGVVVWRSAPAPVGVADVASSLRCPDCQAVSAAESRSELALAMRAEIGRQLAAGRGPEEIREFFRQRYGDWILLSPPAEGLSLLIWLLPPAAVALGVAAAVLARRRRGGPPPHRADLRGRRLGLAVLAPAAIAAGVLAGALGYRMTSPEPTVGDHLARGRALQAAGDAEGAVTAFRQAVTLAPGDRSAAYLLGFALVRAGRPAEAVSLLRPLAGRSPGDPDLLLVLGTAEYALDRDRATLRRFLDVAPDDHAAHAQVRRLLGR